MIFRMAPKKRNTRLASQLLVSPCELPLADLPTLQEVLGKVTAEKAKLVANAKVDEVLPVAVEGIRDLYKKVNSNLIVVNDKLISKRIKSKYDDMKYLNRSKTATKAQADFEKKLGEVFDIIVCQCPIFSCSEFGCSNCEFGAHINCNCPKDVKIPKKELIYVKDQRIRTGGSKGSFQIQGKDIKEMVEMNKTLARKAKSVAMAEKGRKRE